MSMDQLIPGAAGAPVGPGVGVTRTQDKIARALMAAITEAVKGECNCTVCQLMRQVQSSYVASVLEEGK